MDVVLTIPGPTIPTVAELDGAVAELYRDAAGQWHAEIRIPAPQDQP